MKILHVLNTSNISGAENVAADLCMMFANQHEMIYCSPDGSIRQALESRGVTFIGIEKLTVEALRGVIQEVKPDLIDAHGVRATVASSLAGGSIPFVSHFHGNHPNMRTITAKAILYRLASKKAKKIIAVSESCMADYVFKKALAKKTIVLKNIIFSKRLESLMNQAKADDKYDFVFLGRLTYPKNPQRLALVAAGVLKAIPTARFGVIGEGDLKDQMKDIFKAEGVDQQVVFTGSLDIPYQVIEQAKVMLFCSRFEGTPISALEAMYFGVPIVSTPTDGLRDLIDHGVTGYLSDEDEKLTAYGIKIIEDETLREALSQNQKDKFLRINDEEAYYQRINAIYNEAIMI